MPTSSILHDMNFENNSLNMEAFLSVYTREMVELLSGEVCEALLKKEGYVKLSSWSDGLEYGLCFHLNIQKQLKR